jgi:hypothetical protein
MAFLGGFLTPIGIGVLTVVNWPKGQRRLRLPKIVRAAPPTRKHASGFAATPPALAPSQVSRDETGGTPRALPQPASRRKEMPCPNA